MVTRTDTSHVDLIGRVDSSRPHQAVASGRQEAFQRAMSALLGKPLVAQVLARLADGNFLVKVAGYPVRMMLPAGTQVGSDTSLTLVSAGPQATFQLTNGNRQQLAAMLYNPPPLYSSSALSPPPSSAQAEASPVKAGAGGSASSMSAVASAAPVPGATPAPTPAPVPGDAASLIVLSTAGRLVSSVLGAAAAAPHETRPLVGGAPLIGPGAPDPAQLAHRLQHAIAQSGLFYESHLAEWAAGKRSMADLMREPQAANLPGTLPTEPATAQLINQQLNSSEQSRVAWQGQLSAGQQMQWEIHRDAPDSDEGVAREEAAPTWRSGMRFRLPHLGEVDATIVMVGGRVQVEIKAASDDIGDLLRAQAGALTAAMDAAGTPLTSLSIGVAPARPPDD